MWDVLTGTFIEGWDIGGMQSSEDILTAGGNRDTFSLDSSVYNSFPAFVNNRGGSGSGIFDPRFGNEDGLTSQAQLTVFDVGNKPTNYANYLDFSI